MDREFHPFFLNFHYMQKKNPTNFDLCPVPASFAITPHICESTGSVKLCTNYYRLSRSVWHQSTHKMQLRMLLLRLTLTCDWKIAWRAASWALIRCVTSVAWHVHAEWLYPQDGVCGKKLTTSIITTDECHIVGKCLSLREELWPLDNVKIRMCFVLYQKSFSHDLARLRPPLSFIG